MSRLPISPDITISDLLDAYPDLGGKLIELAPIFSKLKNPVLRKTIAKVASLKQASIVGGINIAVLINALRKEIGQNQELVEEYGSHTFSEKPAWVDKTKIFCP